MVLASLLVVNTVVTDRETEDAKADIGRIVDLPGGDLQVREDGPRDAPAIVMLHGFAGSMRWWTSMTPGSPAIPRDPFDLLGHGGSEKPQDGYSMQKQARLVARALDRLGVRARWSRVTRWAARGHGAGRAGPTLVAGW